MSMSPAWWFLPFLVRLAIAQDEVATTQRGPLLCVLAKSAAQAVFVDPDSGAERCRLPVGVGPHEAATSPDGRMLVVCNYGAQEPGHSLTVIDAGSLAVSRTIELSRRVGEGEEQKEEHFFRPHGVRFLPDGRHVVVTTETQRRLLVVDLDRGSIVDAIPTDAALSHMVALDREATRAFVANIGGGSISALDLVQRRPIAVIETGKGSEGIAVHPQRDEVWVTNRAADTLSIVDAKELQEIAELPCGAFPIRVAFTPDGRQALVSCANAGVVEVFDVARRVRVRSFAMGDGDSAAATGGAQPKSDGAQAAGAEDKPPVPVGILVQPDGARAFVANTQIDRLTVLDLTEGRVLRRIAVTGEPDGMTWVPALEKRPVK